MTTVTAAIYLNHGPDNFREFTPGQAQLSQAGQFELTLAQHHTCRRHLGTAALELIFEQLNIEGPEHPWAIAYRQVGHRSLSVGDVAVIGEAAFACASAGWTPISADDLAAALTH
jgi:hypothetical protein